MIKDSIEKYKSEVPHPRGKVCEQVGKTRVRTEQYSLSNRPHLRLGSGIGKCGNLTFLVKMHTYNRKRLLPRDGYSR